MSAPDSILPDRFGARSHLTTSDAQTVAYYRLAALEEPGRASNVYGEGQVSTLPQVQ